MAKPLAIGFDDAWLLGGARTPFVDYRGAFADISPIDLGIKAARAAIERLGVRASDIGHTIAGSMAQASFDAYVTPRHIGLYAGAPAGRGACASGAADLRHRAGSDCPGRRLGLAWSCRSGAGGGLRIDEPQPDCRLYAPQRLCPGAGGIQGFPVRGAFRPRRPRQYG